MSTDLKFFTNEPGSDLLSRFKSTLKDVKYFDVLVGYFRSSGFYMLKDALKGVEKIRILVGLNMDRKAFDIIEECGQQELDLMPSKNIKEIYRSGICEEFDLSEDKSEVEEGIYAFIDFIKSGKLTIKAHPSGNIHAKVYISRYKDDDRDFGTVITGSSNFSYSGMSGNREFNVQLKDRADVEFALNKFEELWADSVEVTQDFLDTAEKDSWLNSTITPYELYLKVLYEYFKEDINPIDDEFYLPDEFMELEYQKQAVISAHKILEAYNGVFLADVVGLGKTYISALLAQQLEGRKAVICPPVLISYWKETFREFGVKNFEVYSIGKLDDIDREDIDYIFIDEAHRFRNEMTQGFEALQNICFGKKVILVTATPFNNKFEDILSQLKLFQPARRSTIPGMPNLEQFFRNLKSRRENMKAECEKSGRMDEYREEVRIMAKEVREKVLKYIMVRRTRNEIIRYFNDDIKKQGLSFPDVADPRKLYYKFDAATDNAFNKSIELLKGFKYSRYVPYLYLENGVSAFEQQQQKNIRVFMKEMLVKRLESSLFAFKNTLERFVDSYEKFIAMFNKGTVLISKKVDVYELLENDDENEILKAMEEKDLKKFESSDFKEEYVKDLKDDLVLLQEIKKMWESINKDAKMDKFLMEVSKNEELTGNKMLVFTESKETGLYLYNALEKLYADKVMFYSSGGGKHEKLEHIHDIARDKIRRNFDPKSKKQEDTIKILITTDILAEGINLHRSNIIINYDLPWNPTRVLQRVGRINRVGSKHKDIYIYNFFPTVQSEEVLGLEETVKVKIQAFHDILGDDAKYLTEEEEIGEHGLFGDNLFKVLNDKGTYTGENENEESELEYLNIIRNIRDSKQDLFERIKKVPKKARSSKIKNSDADGLITFFRKGRLKKFFINHGKASDELTFLDAVKQFKCEEDEKRKKIGKQFYELLAYNKLAFEESITGDFDESGGKRKSNNESYVIKYIKSIISFARFTDDDTEFLNNILQSAEAGNIPKKTIQNLKKELEKKDVNELKALSILKKYIKTHMIEQTGQKGIITEKKEVILSEFLAGE